MHSRGTTVVLIDWKEGASLPVIFNPLYNSTNQQLFEKNLSNQSNYLENYKQFSL